MLQNRNGTLFTLTTLTNHNQYDRKFTEDDGFQVAFAVVDYSNDELSDVDGRLLADYLEVYVVQ